MASVEIKGEKTLAELAQQFDVRTNQITTRRRQYLEGAAEVLGADNTIEAAEPAVDLTRPSVSAD